MDRSHVKLDSLEAAVELVLQRAGSALRAGAPLGLGKPNRLLNALYRRVAANPSLSLTIYTALSLTPPTPRSDLERRFLGPFLERHFGADYPALDYALALRRDALPANIEVEEFYVQSGALLGSRHAQRRYASLNYTHAARTVAEKGINVLLQKVAREPGGERLSLSCNPDTTFDVIEVCTALGKPRPLLIAEVDPELPWLDGPCAVDADFFDSVLDLPGPTPQLFALPREPVSDADCAIGLYASALVKDGGTLQIGIGALTDSLCHALILRHTRNAEFLALLDALSPGLRESRIVREQGGVEPFTQGLFGSSEMINDGFMRLVEAGVLRRRVVDDLELMRRVNAGEPTQEDRARLERDGQFLHGAFYVGSKDLYAWLRALDLPTARAMGMVRVTYTNQLYGRDQELKRVQRRDARFFNTCMLMTPLGAAASDAIADGRIVSGVGGQYNFVAMAHALEGARSVLMFRATRTKNGATESNIPWNYGSTTIPRHLRDIAVTEYGIADLRGACDEDCVQRMLAISAAEFQPALIAEAKRALKLEANYSAPTGLSRNRIAELSAALAPFRRSGLFPDYPLGSDFTPVEQRLVKALGWLQAHTAGRLQTVRTLLATIAGGKPDDDEALTRMGLARPQGLQQRLYARLLGLALRTTR
jgi:acyl-CoA hydrolase